MNSQQKSEGTWISRNPFKFYQPLTPLPPALQSVDLTSSGGEQGVVGKKSVAFQLSFYDSLNFTIYLKIFQIPKLKLVLYNESSLLIM